MATAQEIAGALSAAVERQEIETVVGFYAPDAVMVGPEGTFRGAEQIEEYWRAFFDAFSDLEIGRVGHLGSADAALEEWTITGTHTGPLDLVGGSPLPPTGKRTTVRGADVAVVRDGRIVEHRIYWDQVELLNELGLMPTPA